MTLGGDTSGTNAGSYNATFTPTSNYQWSDGSTSSRTVGWSIGKAAGSLTLNKSSLTLTDSAKTGTINVTRPGDGAITAESSAPGVASVSVSGTVVTVTGKAAGTAVITVKVAAGSNYNAPANKTVNVSVEFAQVFGVRWNKSSSSTALSRLTQSNDPNDYVTVDISTEPSPAVGTGTGSSPFDSYAPWKDMEEYNIINNAVSHKRGESGFSRTSYDTMVYIPEFWFKIVESGNYRYFYIANKAKDGFTKHPGSGKYVGRQRKRLQVRRCAIGQSDPVAVPLRRQGEGQQVVAARLRRMECGLAPLPGGVCRLEQPGTDRPRQRGRQFLEEHRRHR